MSVDESVKHQVKRFLEDSGVTQQDLAERLGVKQPSVAAVLGKTRAVNKGFESLLDELGLELLVKSRQA